jgi:hypothetical protein
MEKSSIPVSMSTRPNKCRNGAVLLLRLFRCTQTKARSVVLPRSCSGTPTILIQGHSMARIIYRAITYRNRETRTSQRAGPKRTRSGRDCHIVAVQIRGLTAIAHRGSTNSSRLGAHCCLSIINCKALPTPEPELPAIARFSECCKLC